MQTCGAGSHAPPKPSEAPRTRALGIPVRKRASKRRMEISAERLASLSLEEYLGVALRRRRQMLDISLASVADQAGLSPSHISKVENGRLSPSLGTIQALCRALGLSIGGLFAGYDRLSAAATSDGAALPSAPRSSA